MNLSFRSIRVVLVSTMLVATFTLSGCVYLGEKINGRPAGASGEGAAVVSVSETPEPKFEAKQVAPAVAKKPTDSVKDEGLGVQWRIVSVQPGTVGGAEFVVEMKNLNEKFAVPPSAIAEPTLSLKSGGKIDALKVEGQGLDLPLGALATTQIKYNFNTSPWNLSNAEFKIGNAVFSGNLNI